MTTKVRIKDGCRHVVLEMVTETVDIDGEMVERQVPRPGGRFAEAGEEIEVTDAELAAYPDKFIVLDKPREPTRARRTSAKE